MTLINRLLWLYLAAFTLPAHCATLFQGDHSHHWFVSLGGEYSEFGKTVQNPMVAARAGWLNQSAYQGMAISVFYKSSFGDINLTGRSLSYYGMSGEYLYMPSAVGYFSGGASFGLGSAASSIVGVEPVSTLVAEVFAKYSINVSSLIKGSVVGAYRLANDVPYTAQDGTASTLIMDGISLGLQLDLGNF